MTAGTGDIALPKDPGQTPNAKGTDKGPMKAVTWPSYLKNEAKKNPDNLMANLDIALSRGIKS